ncbi:MAG: hypothetical protein GY940_15790, partial [bacterium]|nr:hypothetical protein [bacterium]
KEAEAKSQLEQEVKEMLDYMEQVQVFYHETLAHFHRFKMQNRQAAVAIKGKLPEPLKASCRSGNVTFPGNID